MDDDLKKRGKRPKKGRETKGRQPQKKGKKGRQPKKNKNLLLIPLRGKPFLGLAQLSKIFVVYFV